MVRRITAFVLVSSILLQGVGLAQSTSPSPKRSSTKRVVWTIVGAGGGFAAGLFLGLNKFDDAINSDRKVWTIALLGAAAGGLAGGLLSANRKREASAFRLRDPLTDARLRAGQPRTLADVAAVNGNWMMPPAGEVRNR